MNTRYSSSTEYKSRCCLYSTSDCKKSVTFWPARGTLYTHSYNMYLESRSKTFEALAVSVCTNGLPLTVEENIIWSLLRQYAYSAVFTFPSTVMRIWYMIPVPVDENQRQKSTKRPNPPPAQQRTESFWEESTLSCLYAWYFIHTYILYTLVLLRGV